MTKILHIMVNYNSDEDTIRCLKSIASSKQQSTTTDVEVMVVDNSTVKSGKLQEAASVLNLSIEILNSDNVGYFGAFKAALETKGYGQIMHYDHVIISNVDIVLSEDFFTTLQRQNIDSDIGVIAPSIISNQRHNDLNPKIMHKPKKSRLFLNYVLFKYPLLFKYYVKLSDQKIKHTQSEKKKRIIYAPHGSFIIFNQIFFQKGGTIDYPIFLFGEEIYVAETVNALGLKVQYEPDIKVFDYDHGSTSKEKTGFIAREHVKALKYILKNYY